MILRGRKQILSDYTGEQVNTIEVVSRMINSAMVTHHVNKSQIDFLMEYYKGNQPILTKTKTVRPEINNIILVNHAQRITRTMVGYFLGTPIQYIQTKLANKDAIEDLNDILAYENKPSVDKAIGDYQSITGTAFKIIYNDGSNKDLIPFEEKALNPANTFVIYENNIDESPLLGVTYRHRYDVDGAFIGYKFFAYTQFGIFTILSDDDGSITETSPYTFDEYHVGGIPIIEYPNNMWRIGDWELTTSIMDSINTLNSNRFDDLQQIIESLLVFVNADIDSDLYDEMRQAGVVILKNTTNNKTEVKSITNPLDQSGVSVYHSELTNLLDTLVGIPSRDHRAGGGGDTGQAVELRDGWADLELVARNKELIFKKSERASLKIILEILKNNGLMNLSLMDIDIKFSRNKNHNLLVKTQSYSTLIATQTLSPADALSIVDVVSDVNEYVARGEDYWSTHQVSEKVNENI